MQTVETLKSELAEALAAGQQEAVQARARQLADRAQEDFTVLHSALNLLGYYDQLALINEVMRRAWPQIQETSAYSAPAVNAYAGRATDHILYEHLEENRAPDAHDPGLLARLEDYFPIAPERLESYLALLAGHVGRRWSMRDFSQLDMQNLSGLLIEFLGYARRAEQVPYARAHLFRDQMPRYLLARQAGNLYAKEDVAALLRQGRRPRVEPRRPAHPLCPDAETLQNYLEKLTAIVTPQPYAAAALLQLSPAWLRFLESRGLITAAQRQESMQELDELTRAAGEGELPAPPSSAGENGSG